jgi:hypothetical protein
VLDRVPDEIQHGARQWKLSRIIGNMERRYRSTGTDAVARYGQPVRLFTYMRCALGFATVVALTPLLSAQQPQAKQEKAVAAKEKFATGPEVGQKTPYFQAPDQNGKLQDLNSIRGPKGAMVVFFRSADW